MSPSSLTSAELVKEVETDTAASEREQEIASRLCMALEELDRVTNRLTQVEDALRGMGVEP